MKAPHRSYRRGLTVVEVLAVLLVLFILWGLLMPIMQGHRYKSGRISCVNNLKNIGLALRIFSADHGDQWPMDLSVTNQGTREWLTDGSQFWRHWLVLSNELATPRILLCPGDKQRLPPKSSFTEPMSPPLMWAQFTDNSRLSYFLGLDASEKNPQTILAGDRNLTTNGVAVAPGRLLLTTNLVLGFTKEIHNQAGNILLGDGSVHQSTSGRLREQWHDAHTTSGLSTNVWLVP